jgi:hypothetical protein
VCVPQVFELDLVRGTPEYFDAQLSGQPQMGYSIGGGGVGGPSLYASGNRLPALNRYMLGTSWSAEMFAQVCVCVCLCLCVRERVLCCVCLSESLCVYTYLLYMYISMCVCVRERERA